MELTSGTELHRQHGRKVIASGLTRLLAVILLLAALALLAGLLHRPVYLIEEAVMSVLNRIAFSQDRRDEVPNQEAARMLAETRNTADIREIAENLWNKEINIQSDCLKVLYELGYLAPELIADYVDDFIKLLETAGTTAWSGAG